MKNNVDPLYAEGAEKLKNYINNLSKDVRDSFAVSCGTSLGHLRHIAYGHRKCGESTAINIERKTGGAIVCEDLRPDVDWDFIRGTKKNTK